MKRLFLPFMMLCLLLFAGKAEALASAKKGYFHISPSGWAVWNATPNTNQSKSLANCEIDALYIEGFETPAVGVTVGDIALSTSAENYSVLNVAWYDNEDFTMTALPDNYEFEAEHSYYMTLDIRLSDECTLADSYTVYVNEDASLIDASYNYFYEGVLYTYSVDFEVEDTPQDDCPAPSNFAYTLNGAELTLTWDASTMEDPAYIVYRSTDGENYTPIGFTEETTYTCGLFKEATYYYQVTASGMTCESDPALTPDGADHIMVEYTIPVVTCAAPYDLAAEVEDNNVILTWEMPEPVGHSVSYDFDDSDFSGWTTIDADGDGYNWVLASAAAGVYFIETADITGSGHNSSYDFLVSGSFSNMTGVGALTPNNYLVSPQLTVDATNCIFSFWACGQDATWAAEHFGVGVSTDGNTSAADFTMLQEWTMTAKAQGNWYQYTVDLSNYMGQDIYVAIRHFNCTDEFCLNIDDIAFISAPEINATFNVYRSTDGENYELIAEDVTSLTYTDEDLDNGIYRYQVTANNTLSDGTPCESEPALAVDGENNYVEAVVDVTPACAAPYDLAAEVDDNNVILTWGMNGSVEEPIFEDDFEDGALTNWTLIDADGDGFSWQNDTPADYGIGNTHSGTNCAGSWSWNNGTMYPDNYMISPLVEGATRIQYYVATNTDYPDHYGVYVSSTGTDAADFTEIFEEIPGSKGAKGLRSTKGGTRSSMTKAGDRAMSAWMERSIDLPAGTKYVAFRHYDSDDMNYIFIDDVTIYTTGVPEDVTYNVYRAVGNGSYELIAENVEDLTYTDEGLANGTYRYQVTANNTLSDGTPCESEPALAVDGENNYVEATINATYTCEAPTNFASSLEGDELTLTWNAVSDPNAVYAVYVTIDGVEQDADIVTETSVTYNLNEGSTYYFQVTAMMTLPDQTFCESDPALTADGDDYIEIVFTPVTTCYAPVNFEAVADADNNITLTWEMQSNVTVEGYNVYRAVSNGSYELIATVTETTYTDEALPDGTYRYQVTAINVLSIDNTCESEPAMAIDGVNDYVEIAVDGINDFSNLIKLYPNPTKSNVTIEADNMSRIVIVNTLGQVVYDANMSSNNTVINMSNFGAGLYMVNITTDNGVIVKRVTVAK